jgi:hypothetical protein
MTGRDQRERYDSNKERVCFIPRYARASSLNSEHFIPNLHYSSVHSLDRRSQFS